MATPGAALSHPTGYTTASGMLISCAFVRSNPKWKENVDGAMPYALIPGDAPRSDLQLPLQCFNCDFTVDGYKYPSLETQRWRLMRHETGRSGHDWGPCAYRCSCGTWFTNSFDLRQHCRNEGHALPKRYCTKVEVEAMATLPTGLGRGSNYQPSDSRPRALGEISTRQLARDERGDRNQRGFSPPKRDGLRAYRSPGLSPRSPSSPGSRDARCDAHHYNALEGLNTDSVTNTGYVKVYRKYRRSRSPLRFVPPAKPSEVVVTPEAPPAPAPQSDISIFGQRP